MWRAGEIKNAINMFRIADHSENIGVYFYISIEVFSEHMNFFIIAYQIFILIVLFQIYLLKERMETVIVMCGTKVESRLFRLKCVTAFLVVFMKTVFSQYPTVMDLHIVGFSLVCMNLRFMKYLEAKILTLFILGITGVNTVFMWLTWLDRFSGNANFFFF